MIGARGTLSCHKKKAKEDFVKNGKWISVQIYFSVRILNRLSLA
jgi:hypothetical protein